MAPNENDITDIKVPNHLPNMKPESKASGVPKPSKIIQIILKIPMDFNFEEIDACSYDFKTNATDEKNEQSTGKKTKQTTVNTKPNQQKKIMPTKIITIALLEQNHWLDIMASAPSRQQNPLFHFTESINNFFSKILSSFSKVSQ